MNVTFDARGSRLLLLDNVNRLLEVKANASGELDPKSLVRRDALRLELADPQGMTVDPTTGAIYVLDAAPPRIVRIEPGANGALDAATTSAVDLQSGLTSVRGLAFDPSSGHLHLRSGQTLHELTTTGELVASRDLSGLDLAAPQAMAFAPSGDLTDDPAQTSVYVADSGTAQGTGQIMEVSLAPLAAVAAIDFTASLVNTIDTAAFSPPGTPPSPDPSGLTYLPPPRNTLLMTDGEVEETVNGITHFQGVNVWEMTLAGNVVNTGNISKVAPTSVPMTQEPVGVTWAPNTGHYFVSEDGGKKVYDVNPGADGKLGTAGDTWTSFSTIANGNNNGDPEGIAYDTQENRLWVADGVNAEIYQYRRHGTLIGHFDVGAYGVGDPESVEFNADSAGRSSCSRTARAARSSSRPRERRLLQTIDVSAAADFRARRAGLCAREQRNRRQALLLGRPRDRQQQRSRGSSTARSSSSPRPRPGRP